jgi:hypothetical protein
VSGENAHLGLPGILFTGVGTVTLAANRLLYAPLVLQHSLTIDLLSVEVTTAGAAGALIRLGLYQADIDNQPTDLVLDAGEVDGASVGVKTISVNISLSVGRYLLVLNTNATPTLRTFRSGSPFVNSVLGATPFFSALRRSGTTYAVFPATGVGWNNTSASSVGFEHYILLRSQ